MNRILTILLLAACCIGSPLSLLLGSSVPPAGPVLTITAPAGVLLQDSTNLVDWQDVIITQELTVLPSGVPTFFRGSMQPTILLTWDASPAATGYKVYWGNASRIYHHCLLVGDATTIALTVSDPGVKVYACVTALDADNESDFSNEKTNEVQSVKISGQLQTLN